MFKPQKPILEQIKESLKNQNYFNEDSCYLLNEPEASHPEGKFALFTLEGFLAVYDKQKNKVSFHTPYKISPKKVGPLKR